MRIRPISPLNAEYWRSYMGREWQEWEVHMEILASDQTTRREQKKDPDGATHCKPDIDHPIAFKSNTTSLQSAKDILYAAEMASPVTPQQRCLYMSCRAMITCPHLSSQPQPLRHLKTNFIVSSSNSRVCTAARSAVCRQSSVYDIFRYFFQRLEYIFVP